MSGIRELRGLVLEAIRENNPVTLETVFARYDFYQHAVPTLNQVRRALENIPGLVFQRKGSSILLQLTDSSKVMDINQIMQEDLDSTYQKYLSHLQK